MNNTRMVLALPDVALSKVVTRHGCTAELDGAGVLHIRGPADFVSKSMDIIEETPLMRPLADAHDPDVWCVLYDGDPLIARSVIKSLDEL